jgi:hypothetical protein
MGKQQADPSRRGGIDPAALAGVALAGALTVLAPSGPWAPGGMIVGLTLLGFVWGYDVDPQREPRQSWAFAVVVGLIGTLMIGYPLEIMFSPKPFETFKILLHEPRLEQHFSDVPPWVVVTLWAIVSFSVFRFDRRRSTKGAPIPAAEEVPEKRFTREVESG